jgi:hypothetical protein
MKKKTIILTQRRFRAAHVVIMLALASLARAGADSYETQVVVRGLTRPTGIVAQGSKTLYITQLPTPGVPGSMGGQNTVDKISLRQGESKLDHGEPNPPTSRSANAHLYRTPSAGVIWGAADRAMFNCSGRAGSRVELQWMMGQRLFPLCPPGVPGSWVVATQ